MRVQRLAAVRRTAVRKRLLLHQARSGGFMATSLDAAIPLAEPGYVSAEE